jgi:ribose-phosphate pyrophosphokinase
MESATTTPELTHLPGLETTPAAPQLRPEHWIERGQEKRLMIFSGRSHRDLAGRIAEKLGIELGEVTLRSFASGETYCRYEESIRGADMFIVQTSCPPVDQHLIELLIMIDAAKLASAKRITAVLPLYPYSRQDKKSRPRESISAKLVAEILQAAGADRVLTMDLHAGQVQGFFNIPVDHMTALPMLAQYFRDLGMPEELVAVAPDTGRTRLAGKFAELIGGELAVLQKDRPAHNIARVTNIIGEIEGRCAILTDDMIDTAGTLVAGAEALKDAGAPKVYACATHGIFSPPAIERLEESAIDRVVVTDTVPIDPLRKPDKILVLPIADILAETIHNVFADDSVSAIFGDMNALF